MLRVLVCGGRDYHAWTKIHAVLDSVLEEAIEEGYVGIIICHGGASGADAAADGWALHNRQPCMRWPARWDALGKSAGPIRNDLMLTHFLPGLVCAFPGGPGTADMVRRARQAGVTVREF